MKKRYAIAIFLSLFLFAVFNATHGVLLTSFIDHYDLDSARQGYPAAAQNIGCIVALAISFRLVRSFGKERVFAAATLATFLFIVPMALPPSFALLVALCALVGVSVGLIDTLASAGIAEMYTGKTGTTMMCLLHAIFGIAGIAMPKLTQFCMEKGVTWNRMYLIVSILAVVVVAYNLPAGRMARKARLLKSGAGEIRLANVWEFLRDRDRLLLLLGLFLYILSLSDLQLWVDRYMTTCLGRADLGALSLSLFWLGLTASRILMSFLPIKPMTYLRCALPLAGAVLGAGLLIGNAPLLCALAALSALLNGASVPIIIHELCGRYKGNSLVATTVLFVFIYVGQSLCPPAVGVLTGLFGNECALYPAGISTILAGLVAMLVRPEKT